MAKRSNITRQVLKGMLLNRMPEEEAQETLRKQFEALPFQSKKQARILADDAARQLFRYIRSEQRRPVMYDPAELLIGGNMYVKSQPYYMFSDKDRTEIELVKFKCGKPDVSQSRVYEQLELYVMLCRARLLAVAGKTAVIKASYYYLRKANDSDVQGKENFDEDFFNLKGGRNIVTLTQRNTPVLVTDETGKKKSAKQIKEEENQSADRIDAIFAPLIQEFIEGREAEQMEESDCEKCWLYDICSYEAAPNARKKENKKGDVLSLKYSTDQNNAIKYDKGIVRINAGAGAGKTMVLTLRVFELMKKGWEPDQILIVTYTNAGVNELRERIQEYDAQLHSGKDVSRIMITTFHGLGYDIIKREYKRLGFTQKPEVIDDVQRTRLICSLLNEHDIEGLDYRHFSVSLPGSKGAAAVVSDLFDKIKGGRYTKDDIGLFREEALGVTPATEKDAPLIYSEGSLEDMFDVYEEYTDRLRKENLIDYNDQELLSSEILAKDPTYLERYRFSHIMVDEFQDSSQLQIGVLKKLKECPTFESLMVVGDDSQAIFSFRGTTPEYIIHFDEQIGQKADDIYLVENHRSTPQIIGFANKINRMNKNRVDKDLVAKRPSGKEVFVQGFENKDDEQIFVADSIERKVASGVKPEDIAVICAKRSELEKMRKILDGRGLRTVLLNPEEMNGNSRVRAALKFVEAFQDPDYNVKDIIVYLNALYSGTIFSCPDSIIQEDAQEMIKEMKEAAKQPADKQKEYILSALRQIDYGKDEVYEGFLTNLEEKTTEELLIYCTDFPDFGAKVAVRRKKAYSGVVLTTAHSSKGLEWPVVFDMISGYHTKDLDAGVDDGVILSAEEKEALIEEKRRLLFVSATRARDELYVTGQFIAYGRKGDYTYNRYLQDAYSAAGKTFAPETETKLTA